MANEAGFPEPEKTSAAVIRYCIGCVLAEFLVALFEFIFGRF
jgi:hypothetical protein